MQLREQVPDANEWRFESSLNLFVFFFCLGITVQQKQYFYKEIVNGVTDLCARRMSQNFEAIENRCSEVESNM